MAIMKSTSGELKLLMPPADDAPTEPTTYGSPARPYHKREVNRVEKVSSFERLMAQTALELEAAEEQRTRAKDGSDDGENEDDDGAVVHTYKKSQYWSKEVEEKLGLAGADPYGLLELEERRWRATPDEIRKAYRKLVLTHHPDKKAQSEESPAPKKEKAKKGGEKKAGDAKEDKENTEEKGGEEGEENEENEEEDEDSEFKLLSAAWELLSNTETRRAYDSIDNFNDYLPVAFNDARLNRSKNRDFFAVFAPPFLRQAKFSTKQPVPQLGDEQTPYEQCAKFYKFWFELSSWRDFGLLAEHDLKEAEDREERRWMQRQNKNFTDRIKKDERQRVQAFVQLAYDSDPRIIAYKEKCAAEKAAAKEAKAAALNAKKAAEEAEIKAKADAEAAAKAAEEAAKSVSKAASADAKREKEKLRSALKKARKELKALGEASAPWAERASDLDVVAAVLEITQLQELTASLAGCVSEEASAALDAAVKNAMKQ